MLRTPPTGTGPWRARFDAGTIVELATVKPGSNPVAIDRQIRGLKQAYDGIFKTLDAQARLGGKVLPPEQILKDPRLTQHPFFQTKKETIMNYYVNSLAHSSSTGNEMLKGVNPLAGVVHGRSILAQTVQKVTVDNWKAADAAKWGARELEQVRKENLRLLGGA